MNKPNHFWWVDSLPAWGAWIEIRQEAKAFLEKVRSPHGERGLKWVISNAGLAEVSRSPHGERGLKLTNSLEGGTRTCRSPHGERGLK